MKHFNYKFLLPTAIIKLAVVIAQSISHTMITQIKYTHAEDPSSLSF